MGEESCRTAKNCSFPTPEKFPSPNSNFHVINQYKLHLKQFTIDVSYFLASDFMQTYIMLILINRWLPNLILSMTKALNSQNSSKQNFHPSPLHLSILFEKSLLELLLAFYFTPFLFHFKRRKVLVTSLQLILHSLRANQI